MVSHSCLHFKPLLAAGRNPKCDCKNLTAAARLAGYCLVLPSSCKNCSAAVKLCVHLPSLAPAVDDCPVHPQTLIFLPRRRVLYSPASVTLFMLPCLASWVRSSPHPHRREGCNALLGQSLSRALYCPDE